MEAALVGAKQIGFTVLSISLSLIAVFIPLLFMEGVMGRLLREFSLTLIFAIVISTVVSLTVTPMICAWLDLRTRKKPPSRFDRIVEGALDKVVDLYARSLRPVVDHPVGDPNRHRRHDRLDGASLRDHPQGHSAPRRHRPDQWNDRSVCGCVVRRNGSDCKSRRRTSSLADPDVVNVGSFIGATSFIAATNQGRLFCRLSRRMSGKSSKFEVIASLRGTIRENSRA